MFTQEAKLKFAQEWFKKEGQPLVRQTENGYDPITKQYEVPAGYFHCSSFMDSIQLIQSGMSFEDMERDGYFLSDEFIETALEAKIILKAAFGNTKGDNHGS
ncbi:MAG: hypothetical protein ACXVP0_13275 [Bacteroidia bacterium]